LPHFIFTGADPHYEVSSAISWRWPTCSHGRRVIREILVNPDQDLGGCLQHKTHFFLHHAILNYNDKLRRADDGAYTRVRSIERKI
jgi:hypothetical protein